jgi:hypothetical protein
MGLNYIRKVKTGNENAKECDEFKKELDLFFGPSR